MFTQEFKDFYTVRGGGGERFLTEVQNCFNKGKINMTIVGELYLR